MSYRKPTLEEIVLRLRFSEGGLSHGYGVELVSKLKGLGLTDIQMAATLDAVPATPAESPSPRVLPRMRCWDDQHLRLVQIAQDMIVINQTKQYLGWSQFRELVEGVASFLDKDKLFATLKDLELRALDRMSIPRPSYRFSDWMQCDGTYLPQFYQDATTSLDVDMGIGLLELDGFNRQFHAHAQVKAKEVELRLQTVLARRITADDNWRTVLEELHTESNSVFENVITDRVRYEIMQGWEK